MPTVGAGQRGSGGLRRIAFARRPRASSGRPTRWRSPPWRTRRPFPPPGSSRSGSIGTWRDLTHSAGPWPRRASASLRRGARRAKPKLSGFAARLRPSCARDTPACRRRDARARRARARASFATSVRARSSGLSPRPRPPRTPWMWARRTSPFSETAGV